MVPPKTSSPFTQKPHNVWYGEGIEGREYLIRNHTDFRLFCKKRDLNQIIFFG